MKKTLLSIVLLLASTTTFAQINKDNISIPEPEFEQEAVLVISETEGIPLDVEHSKLKTTYNVGMAMLGVTQGNGYYELQGAASPTTVTGDAYNNDLHIIISWSDNKRSPKRLFQIIPLEIQKKRRIYNVTKINSFKGTESAHQGTVDFKAEKYGEHSYLITIPAAELIKDQKEIYKFGRQFIIRLLNASAEKLSDTEDFLTFGIEKYPENKE